MYDSEPIHLDDEMKKEHTKASKNISWKHHISHVYSNSLKTQQRTICVSRWKINFLSVSKLKVPSFCPICKWRAYVSTYFKIEHPLMVAKDVTFYRR